MDGYLVGFFGGELVEKLDYSFEVTIKVYERANHHVTDDTGTAEVIDLGCKQGVHLSLVRHYNFFLLTGFPCDSHVGRISDYVLLTVVLSPCKSFNVFLSLCSNLVKVGAIRLFEQHSRFLKTEKLGYTIVHLELEFSMVSFC